MIVNPGVHVHYVVPRVEEQEVIMMTEEITVTLLEVYQVIMVTLMTVHQMEIMVTLMTVHQMEILYSHFYLRLKLKRYKGKMERRYIMF